MDTLHRIINELKTNGKSQKDLTDFLGLKQSAFTDWKNGKTASYEKQLPRIAEYLGVSIDYLAGRTGSPETQKSPSPEGEGEKNVLDAEIMRVIAGKSDETKRAVLALLQDSRPDKES